MKKLEIFTFGCRLNALESEMIRTMVTPVVPESEVWAIFHTCAITGEAERQLRQAIRKYHKEHPAHKIIVTGCAAEVSFERLADMDEISKIIGNTQKLKLNTYLSDNREEFHPIKMKDILPQPSEKILPKLFFRHSKAFVQIQQGCNHFCTYCIVPFTRGRSVSFDQDFIFSSIQKALDAGYNEINLTGVDIADYQDDNGIDLTQLIKNILAAFPTLPRLRLTSMDPAYDCREIFNIMAHDKRLMPFLHLSMQNGDDTVLKKMNRRHTADDLRRIVELGRKLVSHIGFGADIITGFPEETDAQFQNTYELVQELQIPHLHIFPYSERPGTAAEKFNPVPKPVRKARAKRLRELKMDIVENEMKKMIGQRVEVLSEGQNGYTENYFKVAFDTPQKNGYIIGGTVVDYSLLPDPVLKIALN